MKLNADIVIGTDPDGDRLGIAVRNNRKELVLLNGNEVMAILIEYLKILSKIFIILGIFCIGLQSSKIGYKELSFKPLVLALIVSLCVIPLAYLISIS